MKSVSLVVPDSNALHADLFLEGPLVKTILAAEDKAGVRLVIPEVVIAEIRNQVQERTQKNAQDVKKAQHEYAQLSGISPYEFDFSISQKEQQAVLDRFDRRVEQLAAEGRILKYPSITPKELTERAIRQQAPFQGKDRGVRDTFIWLTAMECAIGGKSTGHNVIFVTQDKAFLDDDKATLGESLISELKAAGVASDALSVQPTLRGVIQTSIAGRLPDAEWVKIAIQGGQVNDFTVSSDVVLLLVTEAVSKNEDILNVGGYLYVDFDIVEEASLESVEQTIDLGGGEILVESKWTCEAAVEGYDSPNFGEQLQMTLRFTVSSIVEVEGDRISTQWHEVSDISVANVANRYSIE